MKPGYLTTEFWTTMIIHGFTVLVTAHLLTIDQANQITSNKELIGVGALILSAAAQYAYTHSRGKVKASVVPFTLGQQPVADKAPVAESTVPPFNG